MNMARKSKFRGLRDIVSKEFSRATANCSECVSGSCGIRDCKLQIFNIGDEKVLSGGLCPKGNASGASKVAPNYTDQYNKILNRHIARAQEPINAHQRILIPRSLSFLNEKGIFYSNLYKELGFDIRVSRESDDEIATLGRAYAHSESCFPVILAHGHAALLRREMTSRDKLLLANPLGEGDERKKFCPYVSSSGHLLVGSLGLDTRDCLMPVFYFNNIKNPSAKDFSDDLNRVFGKGKFSLRQVIEAEEKALDKQRQFLEEIHAKGEQILGTLKDETQPIYVGIGRGYTMLDPKASSRVSDLFAQNGLHFLPCLFLKDPNRDIKDIADYMHWLQGKKIINYNLLVTENRRWVPVRETNFNCGPDSFLIYHEEEIMEKVNRPHLVLETDGHNSNAQFGTRILANNEVVKAYLKKSDGKQFRISPPKKIGLEGRIIGVPFMGDASEAVVATFRGFNIKSEVMPSRTQESREISKKLVTTNTCQPFSFQVGDQISWLKSLERRGIDPNKYAATFTPRTDGPCRLGQYSVMLRKFFDKTGFDNVPIISVDTAQDYSMGVVDEKIAMDLTTLALRGVLTVDILGNALLRTRPYEINSGDAQKVYEAQKKKVLDLIERRGKLGEFKEILEAAEKDFRGIPQNDERYPLVLVNGEIFVRNHEIANQNSLKLLEKYKLETFLEPSYSWLDYVNGDSLRRGIKERNLPKIVSSAAKRMYSRHIASRLFHPMKDYLRGREFNYPFKAIDAAQKDMILDWQLEGETILTISQAYEFVEGHTNFDGLYHVGPFGCMQETVATSRIQALAQNKRKEAKNPGDRVIPLIDAVFGESEIPNLESMIALFAENCYLKRELKQKYSV
jgi:predicted nucleotide-binding protein (sugar kinase/HSP70/actin superfamily)